MKSTNILSNAVMLLCMILFLSCEREVEEITETIDLPDTVELTEVTMDGTVVDNNGIGMEDVLVEIIVNNEVLESTRTSSGNFSFGPVGFSNSKALVKVHAEGYVPNYATPMVEAGESLNLNFELEALNDANEIDLSVTEVDVITSIDSRVEFTSTDLNTSENELLLYNNVLDLNKNSRSLMLADRGIENGIEKTLTFTEIHYVELLDNSAEKVDLKEGRTNRIEVLSHVQEGELWIFDLSTSLWIPGEEMMTNTGGYAFSAETFGFFGFVTGCPDDVVAPTPYCLAGLNVNYEEGLVIWATDFDAGSFDDCDENLVHLMRRTDSSCGSGSNDLQPSIELCAEDEGKEIELEVHAVDDVGNSDYCLVSLYVQSSSANSSPVVVVEISVQLSYAAGNTLLAQVIDDGSYDLETSSDQLIFEIAKQTDICNNGSDEYASSVTFCQEEVGSTVLVFLRVTDADGASNFGATEVEVLP